MRAHEFTTKIKSAAAKRAKGRCERCDGPLFTGKIRYDHDIPIALGGESTLENCVVACISCDKPKTAEDIARIAKAERNFQKANGIRKPSKFPCARTSKFKKKLTGEVILR